jgi:hypothetical protein
MKPCIQTTPDFRPYASTILFKCDDNNYTVGTIYKFYIDEKETWSEQLEALNLKQFQKDNFWKMVNRELNK